MQFEIGDVVKGRVSTITSFGAFLSFEVFFFVLDFFFVFFVF